MFVKNFQLMAFQSLKLLTSKRMRLHCCSHHLDYIQNVTWPFWGRQTRILFTFWITLYLIYWRNNFNKYAIYECSKWFLKVSPLCSAYVDTTGPSETHITNMTQIACVLFVCLFVVVIGFFLGWWDELHPIIAYWNKLIFFFHGYPPLLRATKPATPCHTEF